MMTIKNKILLIKIYELKYFPGQAAVVFVNTIYCILYGYIISMGRLGQDGIDCTVFGRPFKVETTNAPTSCGQRRKSTSRNPSYEAQHYYTS